MVSTRSYIVYLYIIYEIRKYIQHTHEGENYTPNPYKNKNPPPHDKLNQNAHSKMSQYTCKPTLVTERLPSCTLSPTFHLFSNCYCARLSRCSRATRARRPWAATTRATSRPTPPDRLARYR